MCSMWVGFLLRRGKQVYRSKKVGREMRRSNWDKRKQRDQERKKGQGQ